MPMYEIEQYELHTMKHRVKAKSPAHAIKRLFDGEAEAVDGSLEYIEVADDCGLPVDEERELAKALRRLDVVVGDDVIPSIRGFEEIE